MSTLIIVLPVSTSSTCTVFPVLTVSIDAARPIPAPESHQSGLQIGLQMLSQYVVVFGHRPAGAAGAGEQPDTTLMDQATQNQPPDCRICLSCIKGCLLQPRGP